MRFEVDFYETEAGEKPMAEFMKALKSDQPKLFRLLTAGLEKLRDRDNHTEPRTRAVDGYSDIYELRVGGTNIARAFFFFRKGQQIIVTNGYVKKKRKLDKEEASRAMRYKEDWEARN